LKELPHFLEDVQIAREAYEKRKALAERYEAIDRTQIQEEAHELQLEASDLV
jgi:hypothetical protein